jgi:ribonuclease Y
MSFINHPLFIGLSGLTLGVLIGYWLWRVFDRKRQRLAQFEFDTRLEKARHQVNLESEQVIAKFRTEIEHSFDIQQKACTETESRLNEREKLINRQLENLASSEKDLKEQRQRLEDKESILKENNLELDQIVHQHREQLQNLANLSQEEARKQLLSTIEIEVMKDSNRLSRRIQEEAQAHAEEKARRIISLAIQRYASDHVNDIASTTVTLPNEEIKGRIIGREGRNIRAFEAATGVTVLIDDTPNAVVLSAFDPVRRVIAKESMQRILADGRIHPSRIEEVVSKVSQEIGETIIRHGENAITEAGLPPMHPEIVRVLGRLRFRYSFSQNVLDHSVEVAHLTGLLAGEMGMNIVVAKRAGLLHDIGKAISQEIEGPHALVGGDFIRRYGESEEVVNAVAAHHDEAPHHGALGILVGAADAISASRPGARSETMTSYLKRVESLEKIGNSIGGVEKCYAVQAGRELRVLVQPSKVSDDQAQVIARNISKHIEEELQYPGQIRVTVVRETRCIHYAK